MTNEDLNRVRDHVVEHQRYEARWGRPMRDVTRGDMDRVYLRFAAWALLELERSGAFSVDHNRRDSGENGARMQ